MRRRELLPLICFVLHMLYIFNLVVANSRRQFGPVLDLIVSLNNSYETMPGVKYLSNFKGNSPVISLTGDHRNVIMSSALTQMAVQMWHSSSITILATVRQNPNNTGTIISFASASRWHVSLESDGHLGVVRFHFLHKYQPHVETFKYLLANGHWHKVALVIDKSTLHLYVNCSLISSKVLTERGYRPLLSTEDFQLFLGQRNAQQSIFKGYLKDVKLTTRRQGYLLQCPKSVTDCQNCWKRNTQDKENNTMLTIPKKIYKKNGTNDCDDEGCRMTQCRHNDEWNRECCPLCSSNCLYNGRYYGHGVRHSPRRCLSCTCDNGIMRCHRHGHEKKCPHLKCPIKQRMLVEGRCCPVCKGTNYCEKGHRCPQNAVCLNLATKAVCQCKPGFLFSANGEECQDVDECATRGGRIGHHCQSNSNCVNIIGFYYCECQVGYTRLDVYTCQRLTLSQQDAAIAGVSQTSSVNYFGSVVIVLVCLASAICSIFCS